MTMRARLLPLTIGCAALLLSLRGADRWHQSGTAVPPNPNPAGGPPPPAPAPVAAPAAGPAAATARAEPGNIPEYTDAELAVLQGLSSRREQIERRGTELEQREALLKAAEQRIEAKVQELKQLQSKMETLIRRYDDEEEARKKSLVKIFETMKPVEAARIFEQMDMPVLLDLIERMKERNAAPVLAQMHPARAKQVTGELAKRRQPAAGAAGPNG
jgi:flagellar motility protein MotE (MotC chaperone)